MTEDTRKTVADEICRLWKACGGHGPPHAFQVTRWHHGTAQLQKEHGLTEGQWCLAHQMAVTKGARRGLGTE